MNSLSKVPVLFGVVALLACSFAIAPRSRAQNGRAKEDGEVTSIDDMTLEIRSPYGRMSYKFTDKTFFNEGGHRIEPSEAVGKQVEVVFLTATRVAVAVRVRMASELAADSELAAKRAARQSGSQNGRAKEDGEVTSIDDMTLEIRSPYGRMSYKFTDKTFFNEGGHRIEPSEAVGKQVEVVFLTATRVAVAVRVRMASELAADRFR